MCREWGLGFLSLNSASTILLNLAGFSTSRPEPPVSASQCRFRCRAATAARLTAPAQRLQARAVTPQVPSRAFSGRRWVADYDGVPGGVRYATFHRDFASFLYQHRFQSEHRKALECHRSQDRSQRRTRYSVAGALRGLSLRGSTWLKPQLIAIIDYLERTAANHLRHPMFAGLTANSAFKGRIPGFAIWTIWKRSTAPLRGSISISVLPRRARRTACPH